MKYFVSIDEALHYFSEQPELVRLGKIAIVHKILGAERGSDLFNKENHHAAKIDDVGATWLPTFFSMAIAARKFDEIEDAFSNTTIINFNYDRIVEHYLYSALQEVRVPEQLARKIISELNIIRPYGSIGALGWNGSDGVAFGTSISYCQQKLPQLCDGIRTYTEQNVSGEVKRDMQLAIEAANAVVFLGFGFHQQNMSLL